MYDDVKGLIEELAEALPKLAVGQQSLHNYCNQQYMLEMWSYSILVKTFTDKGWLEVFCWNNGATTANFSDSSTGVFVGALLVALYW